MPQTTATTGGTATSAAANEREEGTLGVDAHQDETAARYLHRPVHDLPTARLHALGRLVDVPRVEVVVPVGHGNLWGLVHHATQRRIADAERLVDAAHLTHV